jgi:hypothetical protein
VGWEKLRGGSCKVHLVLWGVLACFFLGSIHFLAGGGGPEEFGGGSANFDMLHRGGSFYSFGINGGGHKNN